MWNDHLFVILPGATISLMMRVLSIWPPRSKLDAPGQDIGFFWSRDSSEAGIIPEAAHSSGLRTYWWISYEFVALFTQVSSEWLCGCLENLRKKPSSLASQQSKLIKIHGTDPESKLWVSRVVSASPTKVSGSSQWISWYIRPSNRTFSNFRDPPSSLDPDGSTRVPAWPDPYL